MRVLGVMVKFVTIAPVRIVKGLFEYCWFGSYLAAFNMIDKCVEGLRGPALRVAHEELMPIMKTATPQLGQMMKGDRRFGENKFSKKVVLLEQTMAPEILAGFPNLTALPLEVYMGLEGCYMDQQLCPFYIDVMEHAGLPCILEADKKILAIMEKAYREKGNCFPKARHRAIGWGGPACCWLQFPTWLYNCWGILMVAAMDNFSGNMMIPTDSLDSALTGVMRSYETGVMRRHLTGGWEHLVEFWEEAERFNCDMVIFNNGITCKGAPGLTGVVMDQAQQKNIHLMMVSNDMFDHRTISRQNMRDEVNKYMMTVLQEEPLDASLLEFDDNEGW